VEPKAKNPSSPRDRRLQQSTAEVSKEPEPEPEPEPAPRPTSSRGGLVQSLRDTTQGALPSLKMVEGGEHAASAAATFSGQGSRCAQQVYDPKVEQEQTAKIGRLEQLLRRNQLRHRQLTSMAQMARSQASQLRTTLDMLLAPDDLELDGAGTRDEDKQHDELTERLGQQVVELEDQAAKHDAELSKLETDTSMLEAELRQRKSAQLRAASDIEQTLAGLVGDHK